MAPGGAECVEQPRPPGLHLSLQAQSPRQRQPGPGHRDGALDTCQAYYRMISVYQNVPLLYNNFHTDLSSSGKSNDSIRPVTVYNSVLTSSISILILI